MKRNKWLLSLSIGLLCCGSAYAQTTVKGKITSEGGEPLIGATVAVKNSTDGTVTDKRICLYSVMWDIKRYRRTMQAIR